MVRVAIFIPAALFACLLGQGSEQAPAVDWVIVRVVDGDTVEAVPLVAAHRIRLRGVSAAEMSTPQGREAKVALESVLHPGDVVRGTDHANAAWGREAYRMWRNGKDVADPLVRSGHLQVDGRYATKQQIQEYQRGTP